MLVFAGMEQAARGNLVYDRSCQNPKLRVTET